MAPRVEIPLIDVGEGAAVAHAERRRVQARAVCDACLDYLPLGRLLAIIGDPIARGWMRRSRSPYLAEIEKVRMIVGARGVWLLHCAYVLGCTALADESQHGPRLRRTLDWPFDGLGRLVEVTRQRGPAGKFLNVTWPGFVGVLTGMAPGRFAAAINQAPMRSRTDAGWLLWLDYALNALGALSVHGRSPPEHALRHAFEHCRDFAEARLFLERVPVARPVIFVLTGCQPGERVVIERDGRAVRSFSTDTAVANAWRESLAGWRPRVCGVGAPVENNRRRVAALCQWRDRDGDGWIAPPVVNDYTRLVVEMCPAAGTLKVQGWESDGRGGAEPATIPCDV